MSNDKYHDECKIAECAIWSRAKILKYSNRVGYLRVGVTIGPWQYFQLTRLAFIALYRSREILMQPLVRPYLEYCVQLWPSYLKSNIRGLGEVQRWFTDSQSSVACHISRDNSVDPPKLTPPFSIGLPTAAVSPLPCPKLLFDLVLFAMKANFALVLLIMWYISVSSWAAIFCCLAPFESFSFL